MTSLDQLIVLIVAEDELTCLGLRLLLRSVLGVRDTLEVNGRRHALELVASGKCDVAVVDLNPARAPEPLTFVRDLAAAKHPDTTLIVCADDCLGVSEYCRQGGLDCACSPRGPASARHLCQLIQKSVGFPSLVPAGSTSILERTAELVGSLTARERQVLSLVASGLSSKDIARAMQLSVRTVESHRARVNAKLGVRTVAGLTKVAMGVGLTSLVVDTRPRA